MPDWWEKAYPGGPMVGPDFPRWLYPPDAAPGHTPSSDGDDAIAVKRTLWRLGRWPGPASGFDDTYSNGFAHGKTGGMVGDSGVAGFQRQMNIQDTGWIGKETANALRSARIPDGLPNAGEPGMDDTAVRLMESAVKQFTGSDAMSVREAALVEARKWIGTKESPFGSNICKFSDWYGMRGPWCAMFATYCYEVAAQSLGKDSPSFAKGSYYAYVPYIVGDARRGARGLKTTTSPKPGDLVAYDWNRNGVFQHVGLWENGTGFSWQAVEGNTSTSSQSNGGEVMRRQRSINDASTVFVRVEEP